MKEVHTLYVIVPEEFGLSWNHSNNKLGQIEDFSMMRSYGLLIGIFASIKTGFVVCQKQRHRPSCASAQSYQRLCFSLSRS